MTSPPKRYSILILGLGLVLLGLVGPGAAAAGQAIPSRADARAQTGPRSDHPRLWITSDDLPRLRAWAVDSNPYYSQGLALRAEQAKAEMDAGNVPGGDEGSIDWEEFPSEMYAEFFAFMSLVENDPAVRDDYAQRAHTLLMYVMDQAVQGPAPDTPFRDPEFVLYNRSRWWGEGFPLTVDWIYSTLSAEDKATIRQVFLRWSAEKLDASTTDYNHPEPKGVYNDPVLLSDPIALRWSVNNYYTSHMRTLGLMAMALDPADDPDGQLRGYLQSATGAWLYRTDSMLRNDGSGGFGPEGLEYSPEGLSYVTEFLLALHTAGQDDPAVWGPQVDFAGNSFWSDFIPALLNSLSPTSGPVPDFDWIGDVYRPAWYGDGQNYWLPDFIDVLAPIALYDESTGANPARLNAIRWIETYTPPGLDAGLMSRISDNEELRRAMFYFLLFDPGASPPTDPHAGLAPTFFAPGTGRLLARTGWDADAAWFTYSLGWITIDHQTSSGNQFEFWRHGEWLTKERTGWDGASQSCTIARSDYHNTLALENDPPDIESDHFLNLCAQNGSQWLYAAGGDGHILAHSFGDGYVYALGDSTDLYNAPDLSSTDILHASRSILWLEPDVIVVYDRATSKTAGRFKRFWLNTPALASVSGNQSLVTTNSGQQLFVTTLLPSDAAITPAPAEPLPDEVANGEPMQFRIEIEAPGGPADTRFLNVLQGADPGAAAAPVTLIQSSDGTPFAGAQVGDAVILFPVTLDTPFASVAYTAPASASLHLITGLTPNGGYDVAVEAVDGGTQVTVTPGSSVQADDGGVLVVRTP